MKTATGSRASRTQVPAKSAIPTLPLGRIGLDVQGDPVSLEDLMSYLVAYNDPTPCYLMSRTFEKMTKFARTPGPGGVKVPNPWLASDGREDEKGEPLCLLAKYSKQLIRVNDNYESAVIRRQLMEAAERGETLNPDDLFVAEKATWGEKVDKDTPPLFEWWMPKYTREIMFYMAYRPVQCLEVWFEPTEDVTVNRVLYKAGERLPDDLVETIRAEYMTKRDDSDEADRQEVDKPVKWRKIRFDNVLAMTIGGQKYAVADRRLPRVPPKQHAKLMKMLADRDAAAPAGRRK